jgi:hypothetical protein
MRKKHLIEARQDNRTLCGRPARDVLVVFFGTHERITCRRCLATMLEYAEIALGAPDGHGLVLRPRPLEQGAGTEIL